MHTINYHLNKIYQTQDKEDCLDLLADIIIDWRDGHLVKFEEESLIEILKQVARLKKIIPIEKEQENE